jgi:redox-sensitive bicupin YhaK (pirin superfamily)
MIRKIDVKTMGKGNHGWLHSIFHFSFADYYNPNNINFGVLRVLNDDLVTANNGFDMHPHKDMEIISYVVDGKLSHADSMNNQHTLERGQVQYMSAGTGVWHSEYNHGNETLRFLQMWILPDKNSYEPNYGDYRFIWKDRENKWLPLVSGDATKKVPIIIHQDINLYVTELDAGKTITFDVLDHRQVYIVQIEGSSNINGTIMNRSDAMEIIGENITIKPISKSHILLLEMYSEKQ